MKNIETSWLRWVICIVVCWSGMSYGINRYNLVPIQDQLIAAYSISAVEYNLLMSMYSWPNIVFAITCGVLVYKFGVRKMLCLSRFLTLLGLATIVYSSLDYDYTTLSMGRVNVGIGNEGLSLCLKLYLIGFFKSKEYSIVFALYLTFITLGSGFNTLAGYQSMYTSTHYSPPICMCMCMCMCQSTNCWASSTHWPFRCSLRRWLLSRCSH